MSSSSTYETAGTLPGTCAPPTVQVVPYFRHPPETFGVMVDLAASRDNARIESSIFSKALGHGSGGAPGTEAEWTDWVRSVTEIGPEDDLNERYTVTVQDQPSHAMHERITFRLSGQDNRRQDLFWIVRLDVGVVGDHTPYFRLAEPLDETEGSKQAHMEVECLLTRISRRARMPHGSTIHSVIVT